MPYKIWTDGEHLTIEREDGKPVCCGWDTLQRIKNAMLGEDVYCIEVFPAENAVVNEINRRHFWAVPPELIAKYDMSNRRKS